jgi:hypothetical protein
MAKSSAQVGCSENEVVRDGEGEAGRNGDGVGHNDDEIEVVRGGGEV